MAYLPLHIFLLFGEKWKNKIMRILHVIPYYAPAWAYGGTPRAVYEIARAQQQHGHEVHVLTTDAYTESERFSHKNEVLAGVTVHRIRNLSNYLSWYYHFVTPLQLPTEVTRMKFDVIHFHEARTLLNYLGLLHLQTKKMVFSPWGTLPVNNRFSLIKRTIDFLLMPLLYKKIDVAFAQNDHEQEVLRQYGIGRKVIIIPLGVDIDAFNTLPSRESSRIRLDLRKEDFYFLFLGRFSPVKGLDVLLHAAAELMNRGGFFKILFIGRDDGFAKEMKKTAQKLGLQKNVLFQGPLYESERLLAYRAANCFISVPTVYEETSTTCLESLLCGTPVITSYHSKIPFLTEKDGVKHVKSTVHDVAVAMESALHYLAKPHVNEIKKLFNWNTISSMLEQQYES